MEINKCRICKSKSLSKVGSLGKLAVSDFTLKPKKGTLFPLEIVFCNKCTLLQLAHNPSRKKLYQEHYWYESGLNPKIVSDLKSVVSDGLEHITAVKNPMWIDIGANDGTLLSFVPKKFKRIGVDPAENLVEKLKKNSDRVITGFFDKINIEEKADVITAIAVFYDLPNPGSFVKKLKSSLKNNGIAIIQLMTLAPMIENNDVGNICHEHIEYYSYKSLVYLFEKHGLEIYKVKTNGMNGGSYRLFIRHFRKGSIKFNEKEYSLSNLKEFMKRVQENKKKFVDFINKNIKNGKKICAYGASTKGNTILQFYGLTQKQIPLVVDINPEKRGRFLINSKIPIVDTIPECDYLWILPYAFLDYFKTKEKKFVKNGGKFVVCTPKFKII